MLVTTIQALRLELHGFLLHADFQTQPVPVRTGGSSCVRPFFRLRVWVFEPRYK